MEFDDHIILPLSIYIYYKTTRDQLGQIKSKFWIASTEIGRWNFY